MNKFILLLIFQIIAISSFAQSDKELAYAKAKEAVKLMDEGKIEESIKLLEEGEKLDPENYLFPYEIAYAHVLKKEYEKAIQILTKVKTYKNSNSQVYQMLGNCYSYLGKSEEAIREYEEGMKAFPLAGNLHLEKGNVYLGQENYVEAIKNYEKGIEVEPEFPSNYFRLAKLFLNSNDKLSGLIYGEIFMNLERRTQRTQEMSELLFQTYKSSITLDKTESKIDLCDIVIDAASIKPGEEIRLPLCAIFGKNFIMAIFDEEAINLSSLSSIRMKFIENFFVEDYKNYPNVLFEYQKKMLDKEIFDAYNHYLFQIANQEEFNEWREDNQNKYDEFVKWYTRDENSIQITRENRYIR